MVVPFVFKDPDIIAVEAIQALVQEDMLTHRHQEVDADALTPERVGRRGQCPAPGYRSNDAVFLGEGILDLAGVVRRICHGIIAPAVLLEMSMW